MDFKCPTTQLGTCCLHGGTLDGPDVVKKRFGVGVWLLMPVLLDARYDRADEVSGLLPLLEAGSKVDANDIKVETSGRYGIVVLKEVLDSVRGFFEWEQPATYKAAELFPTRMTCCWH